MITRFEPAREWLRYLAFATPVFVVLFLGFSPVSEAVFSEGPTSAADVTIRNDARVVMVVLDELPEVSLLDGSGHVDADLFPNFAALVRRRDLVPQHDHRGRLHAGRGARPAHRRLPDGAPPGRDRRDLPPQPVHAARRRLRPERERDRHPALPEELLRAATSDRGRHASGVRGLLDDAWTAWNRFAWPDRSKGTVSFAEARHRELRPRAADRRRVRALAAAGPGRPPRLPPRAPAPPAVALPPDRSGLRGGRRPRCAVTTRGPPTRWPAPPASGTCCSSRRPISCSGGSWTGCTQLGVYDRSLVVVTADHGVAFDEGEAVRGISEGAYEHVAWTPLFIKAPGQAKGRVDDQPVAVDRRAAHDRRPPRRRPAVEDGRPLGPRARGDPKERDPSTGRRST